MPLAKYDKPEHPMHKSATKIKTATEVSDWII